ncbi:M48 family metalloprotease [Portibacter lacus]|uniref:Peptidase M48 n=1 Tax=Portibacter lacus TaxID=1099794 RepID=A0AA37SSZ6_9BACT|nr:M48 family metalloprotease [Portibacter lacus]GLR19009.1 peptidase M48 [Portibacter lacus]
MFNKLSFAAIVLCMITLLPACIRNPVTGRRQVSFMSEAQEKKIGQENDPQIVAQFGLYQDPKMQKFIDQKGQEMVARSHRPDLGFEFKILDSPVINAFALPGGYVYFTRGIMAHFNNEAQFAGVLGHEIGHVTARHSAEQYTKQTLGQILFVGGLIVSPEFRQFANEAQQGLGLLFLSFSRGNESQSDILGVNYSSYIGYDAHEMAGFFKTLERKSAGTEAGSVPEFMSTHPDPGRRFETVNELATEWQKENNARNLKVNRDEYLALIDGIVYGEDPKQGYTDNNVFYHPELKFQFPYPSGWQLQNSPMQVQMASKDGKALSIFTVSQQKTIEAAKAEILEQLKLEVQRDQNMKVSGLPAYGMVSKQVGESQTLAVQTILIEYNNLIYVFHGVCDQNDFQKYEREFDYIMTNFKKLTDPARINVKAEKVQVVTVRSGGSLSKALNSFQIPSSRHTEMAILNGMELNDQLSQGSKIKIVSK